MADMGHKIRDFGTMGRDQRAADDRRRSEEHDRIEAIKAAAHPPADCGPDIIGAPARGGFVLHRIRTVQGTGRDDLVQTDRGYVPRSPIRQADVFDRMISRAVRSGKAWPLAPGQIAIGRRYRDLVEWRAAGALKCSAIDGRQAGSGERDFMDAYLAVGQEVSGMHRRIGSGCAVQVRRVRPSARGADKRGPIFDRVLVDMVCLQQMPLSEVLRQHDWSKTTAHIDALREALCGALDRMIGYRTAKSY